MATYLTLSLLMTLIMTASSLDEPLLKNNDILIAVQEMQTANYFTFVMLINMVQDKIPINTTFLIPNDQMLSKVSVHENKVLEFLSRHSIPSPLLFDDLKHFPTGTMVPTNLPDYMLRVTNRGRKRIYLNNVQVISPNICVAGTSIRCHGINGVFKMAMPNRTTPPICSHASPPTAAGEPSPASFQSSPPPLVGSPGMDPPMSPSPVEFSAESKKSSSYQLSRGLFSTITLYVVLSIMNFHV